MEAIAKVKHRDISKVIDPTVVVFAPLLKKKKDVIRGIPKKTFKYGATERHKLDVFYPATITTDEKTLVLFFIYGGGFNTGDRSLSPATFGLVYNNIAAFYTQRGFIVVIPDYRLVPNVTFPGPAEDIRDAIAWAVENPHELTSPECPTPDLNNILVMGHSAGATHIATMLFLPHIWISTPDLLSKILGAVLISGPYDVSAIHPASEDGSIYAKYWGSLENARANDPLHLYQNLPEANLEKLPKILMVEGEFEPNWILEAGQVFEKAILERSGVRGVKKITAAGHNHVSIIWAICTGQGEDWAAQVIEWYGESIALGF